MVIFGPLRSGLRATRLVTLPELGKIRVLACKVLVRTFKRFGLLHSKDFIMNIDIIVMVCHGHYHMLY
jgi:hypothetical protein